MQYTAEHTGWDMFHNAIDLFIPCMLLYIISKNGEFLEWIFLVCCRKTFNKMQKLL